MSNKVISQLLVVIPSRYYLEDMDVWTTTSYHYGMWQECLDSWDQVTVIGFARYSKVPPGCQKVTGPRVSFLPLPDSKGIIEGLLLLPIRFMRLRKIVKNHDALVLHVPSDIGTLAAFWACWYRKPYGIDVRGSQSLDVSYLRKRKVLMSSLFANGFIRAFNYVRSHAIASIYVSEALHKSYPISDTFPSITASDIRLPEWWFTSPRHYENSNLIRRLCVVSRLDAGKGIEHILKAFEQLKINFPYLTLEIIGDGPLEDSVKQRIVELDLSAEVHMPGFVPWGIELHEKFRLADLFVFGSISEGMPRVIIEAMATGLPIVSTSVGGVPELLSNADLVPAANSAALEVKLREVLLNTESLNEMSKRNYNRSLDFHPLKLRAKKQMFYRWVKESVS